MDLNEHSATLIELTEKAYGIKLNDEQLTVIKKALNIMQPHFKTPNYSVDNVISDLSQEFKFDKEKLRSQYDENKSKLMAAMPVSPNLGDITILPDENTDVKIVVEDSQTKSD